MLPPPRLMGRQGVPTQMPEALGYTREILNMAMLAAAWHGGRHFLIL